MPPAATLELLAESTPPPCAASPMPARGASRWTTPARSGRSARADARSTSRSRASTRAGEPELVRAAWSCPPRRGSSRPPRPARASCAVGRPSNTRASSSSAAVSAALPVASGRPPASRAATITIWRRERPARRPITFTSSRPAWVKRWRSEREAARLELAIGHEIRGAASPGRSGPAVGLAVGDPGRLDGRQSRRRTARPRPVPAPAARARLCKENIASTSARSAGTNAALYTRGSIMIERRSPLQPTIPKVTASAPRILLVDDELSVQKLLTYPLRKEGYDVVPALDGHEALDRLREDNFDLVVLDVMLPKLDGFDVCRQIRSRSTVPIIMLTAKTEEIDKVLGLELGADDYITKPFSVREFRSRGQGRAAPRRAGGARRAASRSRSSTATCSIDFERRHVQVRDEPVRLTYVEFEILAALARNPGRVFSRTMLLERVWGDSAYRDPRTIDVHIRHLREKLESEPKHPELILTVRGVGYRFRGRRERAPAPIAAQQARAALLPDHGGGLRGHLLLGRHPARVEPRGAPAAATSSWWRMPRRCSIRSSGGDPQGAARRAGARRGRGHGFPRDAPRGSENPVGPPGRPTRAALLSPSASPREQAGRPANAGAGAPRGPHREQQSGFGTFRARTSESSPSRSIAEPKDARSGGAVLARLRGGGRDRLLHPRARAVRHRSPRCCWR